MANNGLSAAALILAAGHSGGSSGEPSEYLKNATTSGNTLTLTKKDNTTVVFTPETDLSAYRTAANQDIIDNGKQDTISDLNNIRSGAALGATALQSVPSEYVTQTELEAYHDSTKQDTLTAGQNITIVDNVISATGGSSEGAVRYDEAQSLTDAEKNQVKANTGMPYISYTQTALKNNTALSINTSGGMITPYWSLTSAQHNSIKGVKLTITVKNAYTNPTATETAILNFTNENSYSWETDVTNFEFFDTCQSCYAPTQSIRLYKKNTAGSTKWNVNYVYFDISYPLPTYNNKISGNLVDAAFTTRFSGGIDDNSMSWTNIGCNNTLQAQGWKCHALGDDNSVGYQTNIIGNSNNCATSQKCFVVGENNTISRNCCYVLGHDNTIFYEGYVTVLGNFLSSYSSQATIMGRYNKYSALKTHLYSSSTTYNTDDLCFYNTYIYKSLQDGNVSHLPNNGPTSNTYWEYVRDFNYLQDGYLLEIGNGTGSSISDRNTALTVDWSGNLVCNNIPAPPAEDGDYHLKCSIVSGVATYTWVTE